MMDCMLRWHQDPAFAQHLNSAAALFDAGGDSSEAGHQVPTSRATRPKPAARRKRSEFQYDLDHPRLTKVQINNYRSLEDISLELQPNLADNAFEGILDKADGELPQAPCLLILGENATGKSTILEAIAMALLPQSMRAKLDQAKSPQRLVLSPEYMGSDTSVEPPDSASVTLQFGDARQVKLTIQRDGDGAQIIGPEFNQPNSDQSGSSSASQPEIPMIFAYGAHRFYANKETRSKTRHVDSLFSNADPLPNPEPWLVRLEKSKRKAFNELVAALRHIIEIDGTFENIETISEPKPSCQINIRRRASVTDANDANDSYIVPQKLDIVSSGYRAVIALVCDIFYGLLKASNYDPERARKARALILIDEIEAHLHPRWKMTLLTRLRRALPNATIIATSHDPLCIRGMLPGEVVMMNRYQNEDAASRHREAVDPFMPDVDFRALTIEQLLTSDFFQLLSTDDGLTDHHFSNIRQLLEKEDNPNVMLGQSEIEALVEFRKQITDSLPYGPTEVSRLVQEALADYLANRRSKGPDEISEARKQAKQVLTDFLSEMLE